MLHYINVTCINVTIIVSAEFYIAPSCCEVCFFSFINDLMESFSRFVWSHYCDWTRRSFPT